MDEVIMLLVRRTVEQRNAIVVEYKAKYEQVSKSFKLLDI